jgi:hypothetical protein
MKLHYMGKFDLNPDSLPTTEHRQDSVKFKEPENTEKLGLIANAIAAIVLILCCIPFVMQHGFSQTVTSVCIGSLISMLFLFPHEFIHAICFKKDVYLYTNLKQGMLFVVGPEDMSKARFIFMSLLPSIILGLIPYIVYFFNPDLLWLGAFGACCLASGGGDYINVFNALTQMPHGSRTYLYKFNSYWYMPESKTKDEDA